MKSKLSIVILNYNTKRLLLNCLNSLKKVKNEVNFEVIVVDNGSTDGSVEMLHARDDITLIYSETNLGFAAGNNLARDEIKGKYVLLLNSDTEIKKGTLKACVGYFERNKDIGALSCKLILPSGKLDPDSIRTFPRPINSLSRFFGGIGYRLKPSRDTQEVDVIQAAFFLTTKKILDKVDWLDEDYFLDGEDIDLCWKIKKLGLKIIYYPKVSVLHVKKGSKSKSKTIKSVLASVNSMEMFYKKRLSGEYPILVNIVVYIGIFFLKSLRLIKFALRI